MSINYVKRAPLALLSCGHNAPAGTPCAHRSHQPRKNPAGVVVLRRGESIVLGRVSTEVNR